MLVRRKIYSSKILTAYGGAVAKWSKAQLLREKINENQRPPVFYSGTVATAVSLAVFVYHLDPF